MHIFRNIAWLFVFSALLVLFNGCHRNDAGKQKNYAEYKEPLIRANKEVAKEENEQIDDFVRRHDWKMETTSTGIRIMFIKRGIGPKTELGRTVKLSYTLTLLNGDTVYTASKDGPLIFEVGKGQVIAGLEESILLLRVGDHAKIIIPSHLAFGLIGDQKKIFQKASLVYDMELISMY